MVERAVRKNRAGPGWFGRTFFWLKCLDPVLTTIGVRSFVLFREKTVCLVVRVGVERCLTNWFLDELGLSAIGPLHPVLIGIITRELDGLHVDHMVLTVARHQIAAPSVPDELVGGVDPGVAGDGSDSPSKVSI